MSAPLLEVENLCVDLAGRDGALRLVDGISLKVEAGETVGLVGESGCGKSMTAYALLNLFPTPSVSVSEGAIRFEGQDLRALSPQAWRQLRGARIAMIFQDPSGFLDPLMPVGRQIAETLISHGRKRGVAARVQELLALLELPDPAVIAGKYPHELSGGQRQRVLIAAALAMEPALLIADEPTTALDVTVQAGILDLLGRLRDRLGLAMLLITHDLGVVAESCERVYVMYAGRIVETNSAAALFAHPRHPYTAGLLKSTLPFEGRGELFSIPGRVPSPKRLGAGQQPACRFEPRCPAARNDPCGLRDPALLARAGGGDACWRADEIAGEDIWAGSAT
ncbi:peptide/nickel transport system ATP-binding protein/peptide/nickel transport system permease protein/oligopeptide transport system ATP-binding protein [Rhizobiales bacterium GAS188]|nr:peptide/nickel transport system ATP-binding protein/peptide/nickel transport system permease protein/oligopeptide transport system ATP-binding protein [Rhizobiales bacterium GAS188]